METKTINEIKSYRDQIREKQKTIDKSLYASKYGSESEYSGKSIYLGLDSLLIDISYLLKAHNQFIKISTHSERQSITNILANINSYFDRPSSLATYIDQLKVAIRVYNVDKNKERWELFQEVNKNLLEQRNEFIEILENINKTDKDITETKNSIDLKVEEFEKKYSELENKIEEVENTNREIQSNAQKLKEVNEELESMKNESEEKLNTISDSLLEVKNNEKIIDSFAQKVHERDNRLGELQQLTDENTIKLNEYETERKAILNEAKKLIEDAKTALHYSTASGLSASFDTQHTNAKNWKYSVLWIIGAVLFVSTAIALGVWIAWEPTNDLHLVIGRIAIIPLPIIAAIFCANQYVKQKNIIEDYAYKMVLAKSIVGFSEQLKKDPSEDKGEYIHYIKVALEEIHKDPLRKRNLTSSNPKVVEKIESISIKDVLDLLKVTKGSE
ncbi:hypothetical protein [Myroides sp. ZB35]|uniref:hypothetical protein n=1 Tax=Myroides sp. ZB35 TaxID=1458492 RepID=UPI0008F489C7|nr:hypothetical protein [Myroides sp. ZB35]APA92225.1 hypothetical protein BK054_08300 [Myroides sp. ZB35]